MKDDEIYFRIFLRGPQYPVIVISDDDIYPAFKIKDLGNTCYSLSPPGSSNKIAVVDSAGKEFFYMTDQTTLAPGIGKKNWTKKRIIDLFNNCSTAQEEEIHYSPKALSNKRVATIVNEICTMLATTIKPTWRKTRQAAYTRRWAYQMTVNYEELAEQYKRFRTPDPRIASVIWAHLKNAKNVLNVGAGIGSYEPDTYQVVAVEPSKRMIALRDLSAAQVIQSTAENLPFNDNAFDVSMALLTIHHWSDISRGLSEMLRVTREKVILFTWIGYSNDFWLEEYIPEIRGIDKALFPTLLELDKMIGPITVETVEIPADCTDGFMCAYWRRPESYLDSDVRKAISTFSRVGEIQKNLQNLDADLSNGIWDKKYGHLHSKESMDFGYRIVVRKK